MKSLFFTRLLLTVTFFVALLLGCKDDEPTPAEAPSALAYAPSTLQITQGNSGVSVAPTIKGTAPITYSLTSNPAQNTISIDNQGVIRVSNTTPIGTYNLSVTATNEAGSKTFDNIFTVTVNAPTFIASNLAYTPNTLTITEGNTASSATPTISGTAPFTYQVSSSPNTAAITINNQGIIQVANTIAQGTYNLSVSVTNSVGTTNFPNIYTIVVNPAPIAPANLIYSPSTLTLLQGTNSNSNTPSIQGTQPISFSIQSVSPANNAISVNAQGVIQIANTSPAGTFKVSIKATNSVGNTTFTDVFTAVVRAPVTFNTDIKPIILSRCGSCHTGGAQTNYTVYTNAQNNIDGILNRVQRTQGSAGFMPQGGQPLTQAQINLLLQWKLDGLKEQ